MTDTGCNYTYHLREINYLINIILVIKYTRYTIFVYLLILCIFFLNRLIAYNCMQLKCFISLLDYTQYVRITVFNFKVCHYMKMRKIYYFEISTDSCVQLIFNLLKNTVELA